MKLEFKYYSSIKSLLSAILFLIIGALMFTNPNAVVIIISYVLGSLIIILGLYECIKNYIQVKRNSETTSKDMLLGITAIIIGLVFIFLAGVIETIVRFILGGWILFSGINRLITILDYPKKDRNFWIQLVISLLLVLGGIYTILEANLAFQAIGLILMIYAGLEIIGYIFNQKGLKEFKEETKNDSEMNSKELIEDKNETPDSKKVKDATIVEDNTDISNKKKKVSKKKKDKAEKK